KREIEETDSDYDREKLEERHVRCSAASRHGRMPGCRCNMRRPRNRWPPSMPARTGRAMPTRMPAANRLSSTGPSLDRRPAPQPREERTVLDLVIETRPHDLGGGFQVGRVLPFRKRRMVGPFIF